MKIGALAFALLLTGTTAVAQRPGNPPPRGELEAELRRGFARAVRQRVGLSEDQMRRLAPITQKYATERARIQLDERQARMDLGRILRDSTPTDSARIEGLMTRMLDAQKRQVQLLEQEQRELATIMSPLQRARFFALREQMRRQLDERRRGGSGGGPPPRRGPPPS